MRHLAIIFVTLLYLVSCETTDFHTADIRDFDDMSSSKLRLMMISSGETGCPVKEVKIRDYLRMQYVTESWTIMCKDQVFYCSYAHTHIKCTKKLLVDKP